MINYKMTDKEIVYREDEEMDVMHRLVEHADCQRHSLQNQFFLECEKMLERDGFLSGKQINALMNIYHSINKEEELIICSKDYKDQQQDINEQL